MKKIVCYVVFAVLITWLYTAGYTVAAATEKKEIVAEFDDEAWVVRKDYGLIAKNVSGVKIGSFSNLWELFFQQKGEKDVKEADFVPQKKRGNCKL